MAAHWAEVEDTFAEAFRSIYAAVPVTTLHPGGFTQRRGNQGLPAETDGSALKQYRRV